jgi:hypothetical protein
MWRTKVCLGPPGAPDAFRTPKLTMTSAEVQGDAAEFLAQWLRGRNTGCYWRNCPQLNTQQMFFGIDTPLIKFYNHYFVSK